MALESLTLEYPTDFTDFTDCAADFIRFFAAKTVSFPKNKSEKRKMKSAAI